MGIKKARLPTIAPPARIVIFANRLAQLRFHLDGPHPALADLQVAALIPCLQFAVQPEFHAQPLAAHPRLHLRLLNLIAAAGERERVVIADHSLFHVTENGGQIQLRRQCSMMIGEVCHRPGEMRIPLRPILRFQKCIGAFQSQNFRQTQVLHQTILGG